MKTGPFSKGARALRRRLEGLARLLRDPARWSADHYRRSNDLFFVAVRKEEWREPEGSRVVVEE